MFEVKLRYLGIYASNSFQRFPIPHVIWICVCAMSCVKKFNEHFNILNVILHQIHITLGLVDGQKLPISRIWSREEMGTQASLDPSLNILRCKICHSLDSEGNKSKCQKSNLKSDSFLPMFDITRIHTMNTPRCQLIKVR